MFGWFKKRDIPKELLIGEWPMVFTNAVFEESRYLRKDYELLDVDKVIASKISFDTISIANTYNLFSTRVEKEYVGLFKMRNNSYLYIRGTELKVGENYHWHYSAINKADFKGILERLDANIINFLKLNKRLDQ